MTDPKHFIVSGDKHYIKRVVDNATSIEGILSVNPMRDTAARINYDPSKTNLSAINKLLRQYRSEKGGN